jgi:hypothetical protein
MTREACRTFLRAKTPAGITWESQVIDLFNQKMLEQSVKDKGMSASLKNLDISTADIVKPVKSKSQAKIIGSLLGVVVSGD